MAKKLTSEEVRMSGGIETSRRLFVPSNCPYLGRRMSNLEKEFGIKITPVESRSRTIKKDEPIRITGDVDKIGFFITYFCPIIPW